MNPRNTWPSIIMCLSWTRVNYHTKTWVNCCFQKGYMEQCIVSYIHISLTFLRFMTQSDSKSSYILSHTDDIKPVVLVHGNEHWIASCKDAVWLEMTLLSESRESILKMNRWFYSSNTQSARWLYEVCKASSFKWVDNYPTLGDTVVLSFVFSFIFRDLLINCGSSAYLNCCLEQNESPTIQLQIQDLFNVK